MISYQMDVEGITADRLRGFFVGWPNPPSPETHLRLLQQSYRIVVAVDGETNRVVGFINAVSDGVLSAYLPLLEVLPEYQGRGIGKELVRRLLTELQNLYMIDLVCDADLQPFYEKLGLRKATAMMIRNYDRQSGEAT